jgi:hypothetical protein
MSSSGMVRSSSITKKLSFNAEELGVRNATFLRTVPQENFLCKSKEKIFVVKSGLVCRDVQKVDFSEVILKGTVLELNSEDSNTPCCFEDERKEI